MTKKYRLIPEKEYEKWRASQDAAYNQTHTTTTKDPVPVSVENKMIQDAQRMKNYEDMKAEQMSKMGVAAAPTVAPTPIILKETSTQSEQETSPIRTHPRHKSQATQPEGNGLEDENVEESTRQNPPKRARMSAAAAAPVVDDDTKARMKKVVNFLHTIGITHKDGMIVVGGKPIPGSSYLDTIKQLTDARMKRSDTTMMIIARVRNCNKNYDNVFTRGILNVINQANVSMMNASTSNSDDDVNRTQSSSFVKWENY